MMEFQKFKDSKINFRVLVSLRKIDKLISVNKTLLFIK